MRLPGTGGARRQRDVCTGQGQPGEGCGGGQREAAVAQRQQSPVHGRGLRRRGRLKTQERLQVGEHGAKTASDRSEPGHRQTSESRARRRGGCGLVQPARRVRGVNERTQARLQPAPRADDRTQPIPQAEPPPQPTLFHMFDPPPRKARAACRQSSRDPRRIAPRPGACRPAGHRPARTARRCAGQPTG